MSSTAAILVLHDTRDPAWYGSYVDALAARWKILPLAEMVDAVESGVLRDHSCAITFDDGYRTLLSCVHPVMQRKKLPYTVFALGDAITTGAPPWFVRLQNLERGFPRPAVASALGVQRRRSARWPLQSILKEIPLPELLERLDRAERALSSSLPRGVFLDAAELAGLARSPLVTIGSHTAHHPVLSILGLDDQKREIEGGINAIGEIIGSQPRYFAYPNGQRIDFNAGTHAILKEAGVRAACTTEQRRLRSDSNLLALPRLGVAEGHSIRRLQLKTVVRWPGVFGIVENSRRLAVRRHPGSFYRS